MQWLENLQRFSQHFSILRTQNMTSSTMIFRYKIPLVVTKDVSQEQKECYICNKPTNGKGG
jgi:hypothetical protein